MWHRRLGTDRHQDIRSGWLFGLSEWQRVWWGSWVSLLSDITAKGVKLVVCTDNNFLYTASWLIFTGKPDRYPYRGIKQINKQTKKQQSSAARLLHIFSSATFFYKTSVLIINYFLFKFKSALKHRFEHVDCCRIIYCNHVNLILPKG